MAATDLGRQAVRRTGRPPRRNVPASRSRRWLGWRPAGAVGAGLALLLATPPVGVAPAAVAGPALLLLAVRGARLRAATGLALLAGLVYLVPLLSWARAPGVDAWLLLAAAESVLFALLGPALGLVARLPGAPVLAASVWTLDEAVRDRVPFGGFPWARLAFTQPSGPFTHLAALGGAPLLSFAVALTGSALGQLAARAWPRRTLRPAAPAARPAALLLLLALLAPVAGVAAAAAAPSWRAAPRLRIAVVQGNVPDTGYAAFRRRRLVLSDHVRETLLLAARIRAGRAAQPALVVWPENSSDVDPLTDPLAAAELDRAAAAVRAPILVGAVLAGPRPRTVYNVGLLWGPRGPLGPRYVKRHPVPFGEYLPFRAELTRWVGRFRALLPNDFLPGHRPGVLPVAGTEIGDVICFEIAYDGIVRQAVDAGGRLLVVQTNNATFGRTGESAQQVAMARVRAVEHDRAVLVASTTGISAVITPGGREVARTSEFTAATLSARVPLLGSRTLADELGGFPEALVCLVAFVGLAAAGGRAVADRRAKGAQ